MTDTNWYRLELDRLRRAMDVACIRNGAVRQEIRDDLNKSMEREVQHLRARVAKKASPALSIAKAGAR